MSGDTHIVIGLKTNQVMVASGCHRTQNLLNRQVGKIQHPACLLQKNVHYTGSPGMQFSEFVSGILDGLQQPPGLWSSTALCLLMLWTWLVPNAQLHWHLHSAEEPTAQAAADPVQDLPLLLATRLTFVSDASHQRSPHSLYTIAKQNQLVHLS